MRKHGLTLIISVMAWASSFATGDSLNYLTTKDTLLVTVGNSNNKFLEHRLEKGQTLYSLAGFYGLKFTSLFQFNPGLNPEGPFQKGHPIRIPLPDSAIVTSINGQKGEYVPLFYEVKPQETMYRISKVYFDIPIETLKANNNLTGNELKIGQMLQVGWLSTSGIPDSLQHLAADPFSANIADLMVAYQSMEAQEKVYFHKGAAYWHRERKGETEFFAMHRLAPVGSVIKVINPMKNKIAYARVVGVISDRLHGKDVIVVLSTPVAKYLDAKDPRFFVEVRYFQ